MNKFLKSLLITLVCTTAVACEPEWDDATKNEYMNSCNDSSKELKNIDTHAYCACTYEKLVAKYEHPGKLGALSEQETTAVMTKIGEQCMSKLMPELSKMMEEMKKKEKPGK